VSFVDEVRDSVAERIREFRYATGRMTPGPLLVRGALFAFGVCALLVALPGELLARPASAGTVVVFAALPALFPRSRMTTIALLVAIAGWMASTLLYREPVTVPRLVTLACLLYLVHTASALAAVLPYDTVVSPGVLVAWLARTALVLALTAGFAVAAAFGVAATAGQPLLVASIAGLLLMAALAGLLAALRNR
jgi:hypothetical protein